MGVRHAAAMLATVALVTVTASACTGVWNREEEAIDIKDAVAGMPGVADVDLVYANGVFEGTRFDLDVEMEGATDQQVADVAQRIDDMRGDDFAEHDQTVALHVAHWATIHAGADLPDDMARLTAQVRQIRAHVADGTVDWYTERTSGGPVIELYDTTASTPLVDSILNVFGDNAFAELRATPSHESDAPSWWVRGAFTAADKQRVDRQLAAAAPAVPRYISFEDGHLRTLGVDLPAPATAYTDLERLIHALGPVGPEHPVDLRWGWARHQPGARESGWAGSATIGRCTGGSTTADEQTPEAAALEDRVQENFGCA